MTETRSADRLPDATNLGRTALRVDDVDEEVAFYRDVVGLSVLADDGDAATLGAGGAPIVRLEASDRPPRDPNETGLYHNAFRVPSRGALGDALARVRQQSRLDGATDHGFSEALYLADPEGNGVEIYRDRPRADWPFDDEGHLRPDASRPLDLDALAADAAGESAAPPGTDLGHVHLEVASVPEATDFYVGTLGFRPTMAMPPNAAFVSAGGYHHHVGLNSWNGRSLPAEGLGLAWVEVVLPDRDALDAVTGRLADADVPVTETDDGFAVADPDGIELRFRAE